MTDPAREASKRVDDKDASKHARVWDVKGELPTFTVAIATIFMLCYASHPWNGFGNQIQLCWSRNYKCNFVNCLWRFVTIKCTKCTNTPFKRFHSLLWSLLYFWANCRIVIIKMVPTTCCWSSVSFVSRQRAAQATGGPVLEFDFQRVFVCVQIDCFLSEALSPLSLSARRAQKERGQYIDSGRHSINIIITPLTLSMASSCGH